MAFPFTARITFVEKGSIKVITQGYQDLKLETIGDEIIDIVSERLADKVMANLNAKISSDIDFAVRNQVTKSLNYISDFFNTKCAADILNFGLFPNLKEVTESAAAYWAVRKHLSKFELNDPNVTLVSVGDGSTPRTAAYCAFRSNFNCISVDPELKNLHRYKSINRLTCYDKKIEEIEIEADRVILLMVHSHAKLEVTLSRIKAKEIAIIAIPCCVKMHLPTEPDMTYQDVGILSEKNTVLVWKDLKCTNL